MTKKLYDVDSHIQKFQARVIACTATEKGFAVELDQTAFFAEGGGQQADRGELDGQKVLDVKEKEEHIYHYVKEAIAVDKMVEGQIDWTFRFTNMQQHSGEHILSGIAYAWKGYHNVGFHMNDTLTTIDFDGPLTAEELQELEIRANRVIYENQPVIIEYPPQEELDQLDYRSKKKLTGAIRIVKVGDSDCCACCAPHVRTTGEVGIVKIIHAENYKGGVRLTIVCGERAVRDYECKNQLLKEIGARLSAKPEQVAKAVEKQEKELQQLKEKMAALAQELVQYKLEQVEPEGSVCFVETALDPVAARNLVNGLAAKVSGHGAVLLPKTEIRSSAEGEYQYIIGSTKEDVRPLAKELAAKFGGRGGGSAQMVQGTVTGEAEAIVAFLTGTTPHTC